jgi:hypothetical protein
MERDEIGRGERGHVILDESLLYTTLSGIEASCEYYAAFALNQHFQDMCGKKVLIVRCTYHSQLHSLMGIYFRDTNIVYYSSQVEPCAVNNPPRFALGKKKHLI